MSGTDESPQSSSANNLARITIEPSRAMRLMFGKRKEGQTVFLRPDGLRSRAIRESRQKLNLEQSTRQINDVIETVASLGSTFDETSTSEPTSSGTSGAGCPVNRIGKHKYHAPKKYHGTSTMVEHKKRWNYQMACDINSAEQSEEGEMYYIAHPFLPMPRNRRNGTSTAIRMNYAAQRLDNRKYRGQVRAVNEIQNHESVKCGKCGMCYFFESIKMQQRISYLLPLNEEDLPSVLFDCPVCKVTSRADVF